MEQTGCFETSAYKIQTPGNYPEESIQHSENGESFKQKKQKAINFLTESGEGHCAPELDSPTLLTDPN
jgi:hypothetical protein